MARGRSYARSAKRQSDWFGIAFADTTLTTIGGTIVASLNATALAMRPFTIVRTHLEVMVMSDQSGAVERQAGAIGVAVVSDQASAIGVTAVPTPVTDLASDLWYLHQVLFATESSLTDRATPGNFYSIDSKAMRKVNADEDVVFVEEFSSVGSGIRIFMGGRFLVKTH